MQTDLVTLFRRNRPGRQRLFKAIDKFCSGSPRRRLFKPQLPKIDWRLLAIGGSISGPDIR